MNTRLHLNFGITLLFVFLSSPLWADEPEGPVGRVIALRGSAEFLRGPVTPPVAESQTGQTVLASSEAWQKVVVNQPVHKNDRFRTSRKSRVKILFNDNTLFAVGPKSEIQVGQYLHKPEDKLRQGVVGIAKGVSMYIINKEQDHSKSYLKIETPTGNLAARGTHGYIGVTLMETLVANQVGAMLVRNRETRIPGQVIVGAMMKTIVRRGQPPDLPQTLTPQELLFIRNYVLGQIGAKGQGKLRGKKLIEVELELGKKKKRAADGTSQSTDADSDSDTVPEGGTTELVESDLPGFSASGGDADFGDFEGFDDPFDDTYTESCKIQGL